VLRPCASSVRIDVASSYTVTCIQADVMNSGHRFFCMVRKCVECKCHTNQNFACHMTHIGLTAVVDSTTLTTPLAKGSFEQKVLDCVERGISAIPVFGRIPVTRP